MKSALRCAQSYINQLFSSNQTILCHRVHSFVYRLINNLEFYPISISAIPSKSCRQWGKNPIFWWLRLLAMSDNTDTHAKASKIWFRFYYRGNKFQALIALNGINATKFKPLAKQSQHDHMPWQKQVNRTIRF